MKWKNVMRRSLGIGMAAAMAFSAAGCGNETSQGSSQQDSQEESSQESSKQDSQEESSQESSESGGTQEVVELKGITMGSEPAEGMDEFYAQLDALTIPDIGCTIRFTYIPWGDEKNQISRAITAKEYDVYVGGAWTDFATFASQNAFTDMKPYLEDCPDLVSHYTVNGEYVLDRCEINGGIYGIPQFDRPTGGGQGFLYREDLRKEWGLEEVTDFASMEAYLYRAAEEFPNVSMINDNRFFDLVIIYNVMAEAGYTKVGEGLYVKNDDPNHEIVEVYDLPQYKQALEIARKWYDDGIVDHDILAAQGNATTDTNNLMQANEKPLESCNHYGAVSSGYVLQIKAAVPEAELGWMSFQALYDDYYMPVVNVNGTSMISIGNNCEHPEMVMKLLEKAHTDRAYYDLLQYGVNGIHANLGDDNTVNYDGIDQNNIKPGWTALRDGYMDRQTLYPEDWAAVTEKEMADGERIATANGYAFNAGFTFLNADVATEMSNMETVKAQYITPLQCGITNDIDADIERVKTELGNAGYETYREELARQLAEFLAAHGE